MKIDDLSTITDRDYKKLKMFVALEIALMDGNDLISKLLELSIVVSKKAS